MIAISSIALSAALVVGGGGPSPMQMASAGPAKQEKAESNSPLAGLPSAPGKHLDKIKALGDDGWLNLGSPAADPKWGKGRGRSWSSRMAYAPDLEAAFLFGEGVHGWWAVAAETSTGDHHVSLSVPGKMPKPAA
jgi:hypothetical protein